VLDFSIFSSLIRSDFVAHVSVTGTVYTYSSFIFASVATQLLAAVKCCHVLLYCVVIFFWSSGILDCMLNTFENRVPL